jgi:hypothetical protein
VLHPPVESAQDEPSLTTHLNGSFGRSLSAAVGAVRPLCAEPGTVAPETGRDDYWFTTEHGSNGGIVMNGWQFSANLYP